jgi:hypothetical protein
MEDEEKMRRWEERLTSFVLLLPALLLDLVTSYSHQQRGPPIPELALYVQPA